MDMDNQVYCVCDDSEEKENQSYGDTNSGTSSSEKPAADMALENEDSSYDSDFETDETCTSHADVSRTASSTTASHHNASRSSSIGLSTHHDVSRTVSDTLGAEFEEYVSTDQSKQEQDSKKFPGYTARVEFALKLGYTEKLVQAALHKIGPNPSQNELLAELIKLGAQNSRVAESPSATTPEEVQIPGETQVQENPASQLRPVVIDGSNLAMSHGNKEVFSCRGIKICVDWFKARGHKEITVFVPKWRKEASRPDNPITDQEILNELERDRLLVFTPSRLVGGKRMICYDDRYILKLAAEVDGIVVSNDNYRDLVQESPDFRKVVEERILMYSFVNDRFMPPDDPLGRSGPTLDNFLRLQKRGEPPPLCPYGKKCTYGNKCKFHHPERGNQPHKSVTERLSEYAQKHIQARGGPRESSPGTDLKTHSLPLYDTQGAVPRKVPLGRARSAAPAPPLDPHLHASVVSHFNRAQMEYQQPADPGPMARKLENPPKSHSIENIASGLKDLSLAHHSPVGANLSHPINYNQPGGQWCGMMSQTDMPWLYMEKQEASESGNMHRKLHRQLTINPSYDPRLYRMHGCNQNTMNPQCSMQVPWGSHQTVSRIASAPAACPSWPPAAGSSVSASEPHLHLPPQHGGGNNSWQWSSHHEARSHLHYHLASIFPEDQVQKAMALFPDETNPQKICAAILNMFHKT